MREKTDTTETERSGSEISRPLDGLRVAITRPTEQSTPLRDRLTGLGASVISTPLIRIADPIDMGAVDRAIARLDSYDWLVFTSANGASRFLDRAAALGRNVNAGRLPPVAAVGPATARAVTDRGARVAVTPARYVAESLLESLAASGPISGQRFLVARAAIARDALPDALRAGGATVDVLDVYRTVPNDEMGPMLRQFVADGAVDIIIFASSSAVHAFARHVTCELAATARIVCIGPVTAATAREFGYTVWSEAAEHTGDGLVDAIIYQLNHSSH